MRAEKISDKELGILTGNYWCLIGDDETVILDRVALSSHVETPEDALNALTATKDEMDRRQSPEAIEQERRSSQIVATKQEAGARIERIMPDYAQRNYLAMFAETTMEYGSNPDKWPNELRAINTAALAKWKEIKRLRVRSNEIEAKIAKGDQVEISDDNIWKE